MCRAVVFAWMLLLATGVAVGAQTTVTGTLGIDTTTPAGTDLAGRVLLYAPEPRREGSSIVHFDYGAAPDLLMEPIVSGALEFGEVDLTLPLMQDLGWRRGTSTLTLHIEDHAGEGFNDPSLGAQRLAAMRVVADRWASLLHSGQELYVSIAFDALDCNDRGGVLAQSGPRFVFEGFTNAPLADTWYPGPLAEALSNTNLSLQDIGHPDEPDLSLTFNSEVDNGCLGRAFFYYGLDDQTGPSQINFIAVALHEIAHGLGFTSFGNFETGELFLGMPDAFNARVFDNVRKRHWGEMSAAQRARSAVNTGQVAWDGANVTAQASSTLRPGPALIIHSPSHLAGKYLIEEALDSPPLTTSGVSGEMAVVEPDGCSPISNASEVEGRIAMIDRGTCDFTDMVLNAQAVGAIAAVITSSRAGAPTLMRGTDAGISIPWAMITRRAGARLRKALRGDQPETCDVSAGTGSYCTDCGPCAEGEGDCDSDSECLSGMVCLLQNGFDFGRRPYVDVCHMPDGGNAGLCTSNVGSGSYCTLCGPCGSGEGDCDHNLECEGDLVCVPDVGERFGFAPTHDVCLPPDQGCSSTLGASRYCTDCGLCGEGEGDCDGDSECTSGLSCVSNIGARFGFNPSIDVCTSTGSSGGGGGSCNASLGSGLYCTQCGPCSSGQGDCDNDTECASGLVCTSNVGAQFGFNPNVDVCLAPGGSCSLDLGSGPYCIQCGPCGAGQGDCDNDSECASGLSCISNVGAQFGFAPNVDVCM